MFSFIGQHFVALVIIATVIFGLTLMTVTIADNLARRRSAAKSGTANQGSHGSIGASRR